MNENMSQNGYYQYLEPVINTCNVRYGSKTKAILRLKKFFNAVENDKPETFSITCRNIPKSRKVNFRKNNQLVLLNPDGDANSQIKYVIQEVRKTKKVEGACVFQGAPNNSLVYVCSPESLPNVILSNAISGRDTQKSFDSGFNWQYSLKREQNFLKILDKLTVPSNDDYDSAYQILNSKNSMSHKKYKNQNFDKCVQTDAIGENGSGNGQIAYRDEFYLLTENNLANLPHVEDLPDTVSQIASEKNNLLTINEKADEQDEIFAQQSDQSRLLNDDSSRKIPFPPQYLNFYEHLEENENSVVDEVDKQSYNDIDARAPLSTMQSQNFDLKVDTVCENTDDIPRTKIVFQMNKRTGLFLEALDILPCDLNRNHTSNTLDFEHIENDSVISGNNIVNHNLDDNTEFKHEVKCRNLDKVPAAKRAALRSLTTSPTRSDDDVKEKKRNEFVCYLSKKFTEYSSRFSCHILKRV